MSSPPKHNKQNRHKRKIKVTAGPENDSNVYYFKRDGSKYEGITTSYQRSRWIEDFEDEDKRFVMTTKMHKGKSRVSTIWLGYESAHLVEAGNKPRIFETIVFINGVEMAEVRDTTEKEAIANHLKLRDTWDKDYLPFFVMLYNIKRTIVNFILRIT